MATSTTTTVSNQYQKFFSKELLDSAKQLTVMDQFADKRPLPKGKGAKQISFFRRSLSKVSTSTGLVAAVNTLVEGVPISTFTDATWDRVDVSLVQYGEAAKITDILSWTELFDQLKANKDLMAEDCALNADSVVRNALVTASQGGVTLVGASGNTTETTPKIYAQGAANFSALNNANTTPYAAAVTDFIRAATQLKINRAPMIGGAYVAVVPPQLSHDLQNDPDWIDAANYGDPDRRFRGQLKTINGVRFVEHTNAFIEDAAGSEGTYSDAGTATYKVYRAFILGRGAYGVSELSGQSPYSPQVVIVDRADKSDPLNQYMTAGWKAYYGASGLNAKYAVSLSAKSTFNG